MATLAEGVRDSDDFCFTVDEHIYAADSGDPWKTMRHILRPKGVCVSDASGEVGSKLRLLEECRTCGEAVALFFPSPAMVLLAKEPAEEIWNTDMEAAERAWDAEYIPSDSVLELVNNDLRAYSSQWNMHNMYAPLVAMVQSSGWGKSRLMCELWRKNFYVFYLSCMRSEHSGFPRQTEKLAGVVLSRTAKEANFVALVLGILTVLNKLFAHGMTCRQWIDAQFKSSVIQEDVYNVYSEKLSELNRRGLNESKAKFETALRPEVDKLKAHAIKLILCVDEARELGENFALLRRSLRNVPEGDSFFCVVLGTDPKVAELAAVSEDDLSARVRSARPYKLCHPLYLIGKSDIFAPDAAHICDTSMDPETVVRYGRPLWAAYYDSVRSERKLSFTIQLARVKLLGGYKDCSKPGWVTQGIAVAVFASIVGLDVVAWGSLPRHLVANHMRTIVSISDDRRRVYTATAMEPVLAAAAALLLHEFNDAFLGEFLDKLNEVFLDGTVLELVSGEVAFRIIMMLAMHECTRDQDYIKHVTVAKFVETMFGKRIVDQLKENCCKMDGYLFFNSFTPISVEPFKRLVDETFARCTALIIRRNEIVLDIALPLRDTISAVDAAQPMQGILKRELEDFEIRGNVVPVQVNNSRYGHSLKREIEKQQDEERVRSHVQLFVQLGHSAGPMLKVDHSTVVAYGIDCFEHLKSRKMQELKVVDRLKLLLRTCENVFRNVSSERLSVLEGMIPAGFGL